MNSLNRFLGLFHRKHRMSAQYENLSKLKRFMFLGSFGFIMCLGFSKFFFTNIVYSFQPTEQNKYLIKLNPALDNGKYKPTIFLIFGLLQRLYAKYVEEEPYLKIIQQQFEGDTLNWIALHDKATFSKSSQQKQLIPVVLVIAGSEGIDNTVKYCLKSAYNLGFRTVAIDPKDLHDKDKIDRIVNYIRQKHPSCKLFGVGIQYGANLLINYASQHPKTFKCLVSIGNPFDLLKSEINLQNSWIYRLLYIDILHARVQKAKKQNQKFKKDNVSSLFELDKYLYNIDDDNFVEWKIKNSSINSINKLQDKTLFLQSKEDPFTQQISNDQRFQNQNCIYITTQRGGHSEWFQNLWMNRWFISPISNFLKLNNEQTVRKILKRSQQGQQQRKPK